MWGSARGVPFPNHHELPPNVRGTVAAVARLAEARVEDSRVARVEEARVEEARVAVARVWRGLQISKAAEPGHNFHGLEIGSILRMAAARRLVLLAVSAAGRSPSCSAARQSTNAIAIVSWNHGSVDGRLFGEWRCEAVAAAVRGRVRLARPILEAVSGRATVGATVRMAPKPLRSWLECGRL